MENNDNKAGYVFYIVHVFFIIQAQLPSSNTSSGQKNNQLVIANEYNRILTDSKGQTNNYFGCTH